MLSYCISHVIPLFDDLYSLQLSTLRISSYPLSHDQHVVYCVFLIQCCNCCNLLKCNRIILSTSFQVTKTLLNDHDHLSPAALCDYPGNDEPFLSHQPIAMDPSPEGLKSPAYHSSRE